VPQHFAHISDPHLSTLETVRFGQLLSKRLLGYISWRRKRRFEHSPEVLKALHRDLADYDVDQLLVTGDLTHIGLPEEFAQGKQWLQSLGSTEDVVLVPGNHDACVSAPLADTFALWQDYMASDEPVDPQFPSLRIRGKLAFIGLSSSCPTPPLMATGTLGPDQLERLPKILQSTREQGLFRVVFLHHPPLPGTEKWRKRLTDAAALTEIIAGNGAELIVHGHGHRAYSREMESRCGKVAVLAVPSASALGLHGADIAHYNRFEVDKTEDGWQLGIQSRGYCRQSGEFSANQKSSMRLSRS